MFQLLVCTYTVHKYCAVRAVDKCKWTSMETIGNKEKLSEYNDPVSEIFCPCNPFVLILQL